MLNWLTSGCKKRLLWFITEIGKFLQRSQNSMVRWNAENGVGPISSRRHQLRRRSDKWHCSNVIVAARPETLRRFRRSRDARVIASLVSMSRHRDDPTSRLHHRLRRARIVMSKYYIMTWVFDLVFELVWFMNLSISWLVERIGQQLKVLF